MEEQGLKKSIGGRDPMNGHIEYPWMYFSLWLLLIVMLIAISALCIYSMTAETDPANLTIQTVIFSRYETNEGTLHLYTADDEKQFSIAYYQRYGDTLLDPEQLCNGQSYQIYTENDSKHIRGLRDSQGREYITPELERQIYRDSNREAFIFIGLLVPLGIVFGIMGILVARNPERYPEWVQRLFYKKDVLH